MELLVGVIAKLVLLYCSILCTDVAATAPTDTRLSTNKSSNVFLVGETVTLTCQSNASPAQCSILFYQGSGIKLLANVTSNSCNASHVIDKIQGCDVNKTFMCRASNSDGTGPSAYLHVTVQAAPKFKIESVRDNSLKTITTGTVAVPEGSSLVLNCSATGCPAPNITRWTKQGQAGSLVTGYERMLKYNATFKRVDAGNYTCTADNGIAGSPFTSTVFVDVTYKPENTIISVDKKIFVKGEKVLVTCRSTANPSKCDLFFYQGVTYKTSIATKTCSYSYEYTSIDGCGLIELACYATNTAGKGPRKSVSVTVHESPTIASISIGKTPVKGNVVVMKEGSSPLELRCTVTGGCPIPNMKWTKSGKATDLTNGKTRTVIHKFDGGLEKGDTGKYTCTAENNIGKSSSMTIYLNVTYKPVITLSANSVKLSANQQLNLTCKVDSNPASTVVWIRNNTIITRGKTLALSAEESLPGKYICNASNALGSTTKTSVVDVKVCDKCENKAACKSKGTTFQCLCTPGFKGEFCDKQDLRRDVFRIKFVITSIAWKDDYSKRESKEFKILETKICDAMRKLFERFSLSILNCKVLSFREGSVISETELKLNQSKYNEEVTKNLRDATKDDKLGEFTLKPSSLEVSAWDACQDKPCKNDGKCVVSGKGYKCDCELFRTGDDCGDGISLAAGIVLIIIACLVFLLFIVAIVFVCRRNKRKRAYSTERQPYGTELTSVKMGDEDGQSDHPMAAENKIEITDDATVHSKPDVVVNGTDGQIVNADDGETVSYDVNSSASNNDVKDGKIQDNANQDNVGDGNDNEVVNSDDGKVGSYDVNSKDDKIEPPKYDNAVSDEHDKAFNGDVLKPTECDEVKAANVEEEKAVDIAANEESVEDKDNSNEDVKDDDAVTEDKVSETDDGKSVESKEEKDNDTKDDNDADKAI